MAKTGTVSSIEGFADLRKRLRAFGKVGKEELREAVITTAEAVRTDAIRSIQRGPKTGRLYTRGNVTHRASAPGQPPATDTGTLASSVHRVDSGTQAAVGTGIEYGPMLEFGTVNMEPRPWLIPALERHRRFFEKELRAAMQRAARRVRKSP